MKNHNLLTTREKISLGFLLLFSSLGFICAIITFVTSDLQSNEKTFDEGYVEGRTAGYQEGKIQGAADMRRFYIDTNQIEEKDTCFNGC